MSCRRCSAGTLKDFLTDNIKTPIKNAVNDIMDNGKRRLILHKYNNPSSGLKKSKADAEQDATAKIASDLMTNPPHSGPSVAGLKKEFRTEYGDKSSFVAYADGSQEHISKVRARKKMNGQTEVINVDVEEKDLKNFFPNDKRSRNNQLDQALLSDLQRDANSNVGGATNLSPVKSASAAFVASASPTIPTNDVIHHSQITRGIELRGECFRLLLSEDGTNQKVRQLYHLLIGNKAVTPREKETYRLICAIADQANQLNTSVSDTVKLMLGNID